MKEEYGGEDFGWKRAAIASGLSALILGAACYLSMQAEDTREYRTTYTQKTDARIKYEKIDYVGRK